LPFLFLARFLLLLLTLVFCKIFANLPFWVFRLRFLGERNEKRESGVNPEQTRCCKLRQKVLSNALTPLFCHEREGQLKNGVSQKTCPNCNGTKAFEE
jgi:hypothetical protein